MDESYWAHEAAAPQQVELDTLYRAEKRDPRLLQDALRIAAKKCGQEVKLISGSAGLSYAEVDLYSDRLAARLIAHAVRPGDRVIVGIPNSADFIIGSFAVWKVRAVVVALDQGMRSINLRHILKITEPSALIAENSFAERLQEMPEVLRSFRAFFLKNPAKTSVDAQIGIESLQTAMASEAQNGTLPRDAQSDELATITFTSGSTGTPKGVMHTHESTLACASFTLRFLQLSKCDVIMVPLPLDHILAFRRLLTCVLAQCSVVIAPDIFIMKQIVSYRPTGLVLVPSACNILIDHFSAFFRDHGASVRYVEIGSEPMSSERLSALQGILPKAQIHLTYGLTEGRVGYLKRGPNGVFDRLASSNQGLTVTVVDPQDQPAACGETGEILLTGSGLFKGYWGDSAEAMTEIRNKGFRTGDMGLTDEQGDVQLMGRMDDILKVCGHKVNPREVESVLQQYPSVAEAVVVALVDQRKDMETLHAFVVPRKGGEPLESKLVDHCRQHLELYKVPARIYFRDSLPRTALGKIQRHLVARSAKNTVMAGTVRNESQP